MAQCRAALLLLSLQVTGLAGQEDTCPASGCRPGDLLHVPRVIIGCWQLLERHSDPEFAIKALTQYAEAGFDTFDTADIYGPSEGILGDFHKRRASKGEDASPPRFFTKYVTDDSSAREALRINSKSRSSLGVEALDLVQFHWWSLSKDGTKRKFLQAGKELKILQEQGKIKHLAGCNMDTTNLRLLVEAGVPIAANQVQYSLLDRRPENGMLAYCKEHGVKLTVFGVVGGGLLSESFLGLSAQQARGKLDSVSRRMYWSSLERWSHWELFQELLRTLKAVGDSQQPPLPIAAVACAWVLKQLDVLGAGGGLILGIRDARHLQEHAALLRGEAQLSKDAMQQIQAVLDKGSAPAGDVWYQERGWA